MLKFGSTARTAVTRFAALAAYLCISVAEAQAQANGQPTASAANDAQPKTIERRIVVSLPDRKLALLVNGEVQKVYNIAVGTSETPSPDGEFKIIHRIEKPTYYAPGKVIKPGKDNPLGTRWIGLSIKGFGIHGTNAPGSIGKPASHGCIRMRNRDVEELFARVRVGDAVALHAKRSPAVAAIFGAPALPRPAETLRPAAQVPVVATALPNF
jgi:lipoprotein-anchoring transpeptidase ErfK/SrfK